MIPLDWILAATTCASLYLISRKQRIGWVVALLNNAVLFPLLNIRVKNYGLLILDAVTTVIAIKAWFDWKTK